MKRLCSQAMAKITFRFHADAIRIVRQNTPRIPCALSSNMRTLSSIYCCSMHLARHARASSWHAVEHAVQHASNWLLLCYKHQGNM